jgi:hypothetical protein
VDRLAYDTGYRDGRDAGISDARSNRRFDYSRHEEYRRADVGYRGYGDRDDYRRQYRQGFAAGYDEGYRQFARGGGYRGPAIGPPEADRSPGYPVYRGGPGVYSSPAANNGYRDGYDQGRDDARHGRRFDPIGAKRYRSGDHDYDRRYGSLDEYKRDYRAAFERGYDQGYREGRY